LLHNLGAYFPCKNYSAWSAEEYEAIYKGREYHLLRSLPAFNKEIPTVEMAGNHSFTSFWGLSWGLPGPVHHYSVLIPDLIVSCLLLLWNPFSITGGVQIRESAPGTKTLRILWPQTLDGLAVGASVLGCLVFLGLINSVTYSKSSLKTSPDRMFGGLCKTNIEAITQVIEKWADQNGYVMGDEFNWFVDTVPIGKRVAEAGLREAWKPSPFDRWQSTWTSFRSVSPHLAFELVGSETPLETRITVTANFGQHVPKDLISALNKLPSAQITAPGVNDNNSTKDR
jgi:hypothetical protein